MLRRYVKPQTLNKIQFIHCMKMKMEEAKMAGDCNVIKRNRKKDEHTFYRL